jgi:hypothetical protein
MNRKICQHKIDLRLTMMILFDRLDDFVLGLSYTTFSLVSLCLQAHIMPMRRNSSQQLCLRWRRIVEIRY